MEYDIYGNIHSYESFGTVDGPGIRFVVFTQGCKLKCKYCHNRDTWEENTGKKVTVKEVVKQILKYRPYFESSGGGVTFSGGDPLLQPEFTLAVFKELKKLGIHTALDTSGNFPLDPIILKVLEYTDLVLLDIKHIDDKKCVSLCGVHNDLELEFAKYLSEINKPVWIRQVLIKGYTDVEEDLKTLREFLETLDNIDNIEILPYKDFGKFKWEEMGYNYPLKDVPITTEEEVERAKKILEPEKLLAKNKRKKHE